jgi:hypothetical protein
MKYYIEVSHMIQADSLRDWYSSRFKKIISLTYTLLLRNESSSSDLGETEPLLAFWSVTTFRHPFQKPTLEVRSTVCRRSEKRPRRRKLTLRNGEPLT